MRTIMDYDYPAILIYLAIEFVFYLVFVFYLHPRANDLSKRSIKEFRDFAGTKRHLSFNRMIDRLHERCLVEKKEFKRELNIFWWNWFYTEGHEKRLRLSTRTMVDVDVDVDKSSPTSSSPSLVSSPPAPASSAPSFSDRAPDHEHKGESEVYNGNDDYGTMIDEPLSPVPASRASSSSDISFDPEHKGESEMFSGDLGAMIDESSSLAPSSFSDISFGPERKEESDMYGDSNGNIMKEPYSLFPVSRVSFVGDISITHEHKEDLEVFGDDHGTMIDESSSLAPVSKASSFSYMSFDPEHREESEVYSDNNGAIVEESSAFVAPASSASSFSYSASDHEHKEESDKFGDDHVSMIDEPSPLVPASRASSFSDRAHDPEHKEDSEVYDGDYGSMIDKSSSLVPATRVSSFSNRASDHEHKRESEVFSGDHGTMIDESSSLVPASGTSFSDRAADPKRKGKLEIYGDDHNTIYDELPPLVLPATRESSLSDRASEHKYKGESEVHGGDHDTMIDEIELYQDELKLLLASCFFNKALINLERWELEQLDHMFQYMDDQYDIRYPLLQREDVRKDDLEAGYKTLPGDVNGKDKDEYDTVLMRPRFPPLDKVYALHRPLLLYAIFWLARYIGYAILFCLGFRLYTIKPDSGSRKVLRYWLLLRGKGDDRQCDDACANDEAILFFHGLAPGGLTYYIPFLKQLINYSGSTSNSTPQHSVFLLEIIPVTCSNFSFQALTEGETVSAIEKALTKHGFDKQGRNITLSGHSFGSCVVTWMLTSSFIKERVHKIILLDPVSMMLTDPDCTMHVVYGVGTNEEILIQGDVATTSRRRVKMMISTELFLAHYLRRHFAWFNSELWIEDIPDHIHTYIMIGENDHVIDASKLRQEVHRHMDSKKVKCTVWEGCIHGDCLRDQKLFTDISAAFFASHLDEQEDRI